MSPLHSSTTTPLKAQHYASSLSSTLIRGCWDSSSPGIALPTSSGGGGDGPSLSWKEATRKWGKHTGGFGGRGDTKYVELLHQLSLYYLGNIVSVIGTPGGAAIGNTGIGTRLSYAALQATSARDEQEKGYNERDNETVGTDSSQQSAGTGVSQVTTATSGSSFVRVEHPGDEDESTIRREGHRTREKEEDGREKVKEDTESGDTLRPLGPIILDRSRTQTQIQTAELTNREPVGSELTSSPLMNHPGSTTSTYDISSTPDPTTWTSISTSNTELDGDDDPIALLQMSAPGIHPSSSLHRLTGWWWVGVAPERKGEITSGLKEAESLLKHAPAGSPEQKHYQLLVAYHQHALGEHDQALETYKYVDWLAKPVSDWCLTEAAQIVDFIRGKCIQGLCYELCQQPQAERALEAYREATNLFASLPDLTRSFNESFLNTEPSLLRQPSSFSTYREAHRWISRALSRGTVISARSTHLHTTLAFARTYHLIAREWPTSFRPRQRQVMLSIYLRVLHAAYMPYPALPPKKGTRWFVFDKEFPAKGSMADIWLRESRAVMSQGQRLLNETTKFPKAGEVNWLVVNFIQRCVELWERSGLLEQEARETIKLMWWAMNLTFQSHSLLRHLTRLLQATEAYEDARRTFELYVQLVLKAKQTAQPELSLQLKKRFIDEPVGPQQIAADVERDPSRTEGTADGELDSDEDLIEALLFGSKLFTVNLKQPEEAWRYVVLAGDVINQAIRPISNQLNSMVEEAKGIIRAGMAASSNPEPEIRPTWQAQAIDHLRAAIKLHPESPRALYHLAFSQAEVRDVPGAIASIRASIETNPSDYNSWHLLALLLSAQKDWIGSLKAIEVGIEAWEAAEEDIRRFSPSEEQAAMDIAGDNNTKKDFAISLATDSNQHASSSSPTDLAIISGDAIIPVVTPRYHTLNFPPTTSARLANVIQLRMTQAVIIEKIDGPAQAMVRQQQTFSYFSAKAAKSKSADEDSSSIRMGQPDLGESFVSVDETKRIIPAVGISPPAGSNSYGVVPSSDADARSIRSAGGRINKLLPRHLHVPGTKRLGRTTSLRSRKGPNDMDDERDPNPRILSSGSSIYSRQTTPAHSHYHGSHSPPAPPPPPLRSPNGPASGRSPADLRVLSNLWLQSAATFRRWFKLEQALGAIQEAEVLDPSNPELWVQVNLPILLFKHDCALQLTKIFITLAAWHVSRRP